LPSEERTWEVADRIHSAAIHLLRRARVEDVASGLTPTRLSALSVVVYAGPLTLGRLADAEGVRPPTMTRIVQALEQLGLVRRTSSPADRRSVQIEVTPLGGSVLDDARERRLRRLAGLLAGLDEQELEAVGHAAELIERALAAAAPPP
jgi:DNA-binding MarR family transcriptional regulator